MARAARIMEILQDMVHIDSETNTPKERQMESYLQHFLSHLDGVVSGLIHVPEPASGLSSMASSAAVRLIPSFS